MELFGQSEEILSSNSGELCLSGAFQGRIFVRMDGEIIHRVDLSALSADGFRNLGGNSLWPAPEGGAYAFNYPPDSDCWYVPDAVNLTPAAVGRWGENGLFAHKQIQLTNRRRHREAVEYSRRVELLNAEVLASQYGIAAFGYRSCDGLKLITPCCCDDFVIAAWSLEQFPGAEKVTAFGKMRNFPAAEMLNFDYYGNAKPRIFCSGKEFCFRLGGGERLQIGVSARANAEYIGSYDPERELLILRRVYGCDGSRFINIADNAQQSGIDGADDQFSIFNGGPLDFYELEAIAPMRICRGLLAGSELAAESLFFRGRHDRLRRLLREYFGFNMELEA